MGITAAVNYKSPGVAFEKATADSDLFNAKHIQDLAEAVDQHNHGDGKGAAVSRFGFKGAALTAATPLNLVGDGNYFEVNGTASIAAISGRSAGERILLRFNAPLTLVHSGNLILAGSQNATVSTSDMYEFVSEGSGVWREVSRTAGVTSVLTHGMALAKGDLLAASGPSQFDRLPSGTNGQVLQSNTAAQSGVSWTNTPVLPGYLNHSMAVGQGDIIVADAAGAFGVLAVGANGMLLTADSAAPLGVNWVAPSGTGGLLTQGMAEAKGDILAATANDNFARLPVGTNGHVLKANSAQPSGMEWGIASGGGQMQATGAGFKLFPVPPTAPAGVTTGVNAWGIWTEVGIAPAAPMWIVALFATSDVVIAYLHLQVGVGVGAAQPSAELSTVVTGIPAAGTGAWISLPGWLSWSGGKVWMRASFSSAVVCKLAVLAIAKTDVAALV